MAYSYGIKNTYRPSALAPHAYAWSTRPQYSRADVPSGLMGNKGIPDEAVLRQQFAYEWYKSGDLGNNFHLSNPPFLSGASGRLHPALRDAETGQPARILRGFIRRADSEAGNSLSRARLHFMYNPERITRDYVSYLNQSALDPFNTVYESGNLVAPPSFMDFNFTLLFDRQEEAAQQDHPGVFVDYQFFDLVVRNVVPTDPNWNAPVTVTNGVVSSTSTLPDNGVMMVSPRDITVVFSPQLTVQGRPLNAQVNFERFTHRMTPTRMTITLSMRVIYMGPMRDQVEYKKEELQAEVSVPINEIKADVFDTTWVDTEEDSTNWWRKIGTGLILGPVLGAPTWLDIGEGAIDAIFGTSGDANDHARKTALAWAISHVNQGGPGEGPWTDYTGANSGAGRYNLPAGADCSGLVTEAYIRTGNGTSMGWNGHPGTATMISLARNNGSKQAFIPLSQIKWQWQTGKSEEQQALQPGDILIREGHVVFFYKYDSGKVVVFDAASANTSPEVGQRNWGGPGGKTWYLLRPTPLGPLAAAGTNSTWNGVNNGTMKGLQ